MHITGKVYHDLGMSSCIFLFFTIILNYVPFHYVKCNVVFTTTIQNNRKQYVTCVFHNVYCNVYPIYVLIKMKCDWHKSRYMQVLITLYAYTLRKFYKHLRIGVHTFTWYNLSCIMLYLLHYVQPQCNKN